MHVVEQELRQFRSNVCNSLAEPEELSNMNPVCLLVSSVRFAATNRKSKKLCGTSLKVVRYGPNLYEINC